MRRRLVVAIAGVAAAAVVLFAVPLGIVLAHSYRERELLRLQRDTVAATRSIDISAPRADRIELPASKDRLGVYDRAGHRVSGLGPAVADDLVGTVVRTGRPADRSGEGRLWAAAPLVSHEHVSGALLASRNDSVVTENTRRAWLALLVLAAALVGAATLAALLLGRRLAKPLERLSVSARRLGEGEFTVRSPRSSIPEADAIAASLDATAARLDDLVTRERAFSADASHQLRTPLAALRLRLEVMELGSDSPDLRAAVADIERLETTIDTLLAVSRDVSHPRGETDLAALLADMVVPYREALAKQARPLRLLTAPGLPPAQAQPNVIREVLTVLLDNAVQHGSGTVRVTLRASGQWLRVDVDDEGPEIVAPEEELFRRRAGAGHGIGLALARSLAHAEGGRVSLSDPGPGPRFTLTLEPVGAPA